MSQPEQSPIGKAPGGRVDHHAGFDEALDDLLNKLHEPGQYAVQLRVAVRHPGERPGRIDEYIVVPEKLEPVESAGGGPAPPASHQPDE